MAVFRPPLTDPDLGDKAITWPLLNFSRPHMRAFWYAALGFCSAFFIWFAVSPLMPEIKKTLKLSKEDVWTSNIVGVAGTIAARFIVGPFIDKYGSRRPAAWLLILCAIPTGCIGAARNLTELCIIRFFIGLVGSFFVVCSAWTSAMFAPNIVGTANGFAAGWGNMGAGITYLVMGFLLFPLFKMGMTAELAWRTVFIIPAVVTMSIGFIILFTSDDCPKGNYSELKKKGELIEAKASKSFRVASFNINTWLMAFQYACTFGVELTFDAALSSYFKERFNMTTERAALFGSTFGLLNLFSRGCGGLISDWCNRRWGMRGRLWLQAFVIIGGGVSCIFFGRADNQNLAVAILVIFSLFCQAGCGTSFGIAPYIDPRVTGSVYGIVGAGGNIGAVCFGLIFKYLGNSRGFEIMGAIIVASSVSVAFMRIPGHRTMFFDCGAKFDRNNLTGYLVNGEAYKTQLYVPKPAKTVDEDV
jgi:NNP family nitrate/nitrite transporter-like MFS transporter